MNRKERRAAERAARKIAQKQSNHSTPAVSEAKVAANQANAQHSTGPRTPAGRAKSSRNSFKHGLYSKCLVVEGEDPAQLDALRADLFAEHQPQTETEALLVNEMAEQYWRLRRARLMEAFLLNDDPIYANLNSVHRMMTNAERGFHKALKTLTELRKANGFVPQKQPVETASESPSAPEIGFVPQNAPEAVEEIPQPQLTEDDLAEMEEEIAAMDALMTAA